MRLLPLTERFYIFVLLDRREYPGFALFRGQRIHLGAYEAAVRASVSLCAGSAVVFQGSGELLMCQASGDLYCPSLYGQHKKAPMRSEERRVGKECR